MRINSLTIAGFGPYKEAQHVDFDAFATDGIFLISGKTGAGKSSILDAICFALYDTVPRYDGTHTQLRSHHALDENPSFVELEFTTGETRYRVRRTPEYERPAKRGGGMTKQVPEVLLEVLRDGSWEGVAAKPREVGHELTRILGLSKDQFLQVILLAQNRFQEFLLAKSEERQEVLQALFGTERFERYELAIVERSKTLADRLGSAREQRAHDAQRAADLLPVDLLRVEPVDPATEDFFVEGLTLLTSHLEQATQAVIAAQVTADADTAALATLTEQLAQQRRRDSALTQQVALEQQKPAIALARESIASAGRADAVAPSIAAAASADSALAAAAGVEADARAGYRRFGDADTGSLDEIIDAHSRDLGALEEAIADEETLPVLHIELSGHLLTLTDLEKQLESVALRSAELPALIAATQGELTSATVESGRAGDAIAAVERLTIQRAAAVEASRLAPRLEAAQTAELAASSDQTAAAQALENLLRQRLHGHAGELAAGLVDGEPCGVCGSTEHPRPATPSSEPVTEADIDAARQQVDAFRELLAEAAATTKTLAAEHATAAISAGGTSTEQLDAALSEAIAAKRASAVAGATAARLERELESLVAELDSAAARAARLRDELQQQSAKRAAIEDRLAELDARLTRHRGEFASVTERAENIRAGVAAARALVDAIAGREQRASAAEAASEALAALLVAQGFSSAAAASECLITPAERQRLEHQVLTHERAVAVAQATLADRALQSLPAEPVQLDAATEAARESRTALAELTGSRGSIAERHTQFVALLSQVNERSAASADLTAEFEQIESLALAVQGKGANTRRMRLETYVLAAQLEEIVAAANGRLRTMTGGRYELQHDDSVAYRNTRSGLGLAILDQHTGRARATHSLSGGETFLASLALALGLAEVVTNQSGGITLDTLFVDEGFGSLDGDTLEIAMSTLDSLRAGGRTIGLISHVDAMKEQIHAKLTITVADAGYSEISQA